VNVDLKEFRSAFVAEAEEHLSAIGSLVLSIERGLREGGATSSSKELRELMRLLHTIKGLAAMVGVEPIVTIAHKMETVVRSAERTGGALGERAIEGLLGGTRAIETRVHAVAENRTPAMPPADLVAALESVEPEPPAARSEEPMLDEAIASKLVPSERAQLQDGIRRGRRALAVVFAPSNDKVNHGVSITSVRERLRAVAEIVKVLPATVAPSETAPGGLVFTLILLTDASDEVIAEAASVEVSEVRLLLATGAPKTPPTPTPWSSEPEEDDTPDGSGRGVLRVEVGRIDDAIDMLGSLVVTRSRMNHVVERLEASGADMRELRALMTDNARQLRELRAAILRVRMIPMAAILERLPLVVRGLARTSGKQVRIELDVGTAELDKTVAERLFPALVHLVRNAVDHGIESPAERAASGKPETAKVRVVATTVDRNVEIRLSDDGRGVDRAAVAASAKAPLPATDAALLDLLCRPGMSTRSEADSTSGRGVGMDIVRKTVVNQLGGELSLETRAGAGTTFTLRVPLTVAIVEAFTVRCGGERFAIPVPIVEEIVELGDSRMVTAPSPTALVRAKESRRPTPKLLARRGETVPVFDLAEMLDLPAARSCPHGLLVRRGAGEVIGYAVDRVIGQQEIVVRPLVDALVSSAAISGSTDLGDGRATVVLDLLALASTLDAEGRAA
jgi:two-component system chemotaxis sensor kinase CheA